MYLLLSLHVKYQSLRGKLMTASLILRPTIIKDKSYVSFHFSHILKKTLKKHYQKMGGAIGIEPI